MTYHMPLWHLDLALNGRPEQHRKPGHRFCLQCNAMQCNDKIKIYFPRCKTKTPFQINFGSNTDSMKRQFCYAGLLSEP